MNPDDFMGDPDATSAATIRPGGGVDQARSLDNMP